MGFRGGWSYILPTVNLLEDPLPQDSLSENLKTGVMSAHRRINKSPQEMRNFRRDMPTGNPAVKK